MRFATIQQSLRLIRDAAAAAAAGRWTTKIKLKATQTQPFILNMSNDAVVSINQLNRATIGAEKTSTFEVTLYNPDDYTDLGAIPGLAAGTWTRVGQDDAVDVAEAIGEILKQHSIPYRVEWP